MSSQKFRKTDGVIYGWPLGMVCVAWHVVVVVCEHGSRTHDGKVLNSLRPNIKFKSQTGYKGLAFCRNNGLLMKKMGADKLSENTPNAPKFICPNCLPKSKSFGISMKKDFIGCPKSMFVSIICRPFVRKVLSSRCSLISFHTIYASL